MTTLLEDLKAAHVYAREIGGRRKEWVTYQPLTIEFRTPANGNRGVSVVYLVASLDSKDVPEPERTVRLVPTMMVYEMNNVGLHEHYDILTALTRARDMLSRLMNLFPVTDKRWTVMELAQTLAELDKERGEA